MKQHSGNYGQAPGSENPLDFLRFLLDFLTFIFRLFATLPA